MMRARSRSGCDCVSWRSNRSPGRAAELGARLSAAEVRCGGAHGEPRRTCLPAVGVSTIAGPSTRARAVWRSAEHLDVFANAREACVPAGPEARR